MEIPQFTMPGLLISNFGTKYFSPPLFLSTYFQRMISQGLTEADVHAESKEKQLCK